MALAATRTYFTVPFSSMIFTRCRFGAKIRLLTLVTCRPIPPSFFALPLRLMLRLMLWLVLLELLLRRGWGEGWRRGGLRADAAPLVALLVVRLQRRPARLLLLRRLVTLGGSGWVGRAKRGQWLLAQLGLPQRHAIRQPPGLRLRLRRPNRRRLGRALGPARRRCCVSSHAPLAPASERAPLRPPHPQSL